MPEDLKHVIRSFSERAERLMAGYGRKLEQGLSQALRLGPDFALIAAATLVLVVLFAFGSGVLRAVFGLVWTTFIPGYCMGAAFLPRRLDLDFLERIALSIGLSIGVVPLIGLILAYSPFGVRFWPILVSLLLFSAAMASIAAYRRSRLPQEDLVQLRLRPGSVPYPGQWDRLTQVLAGVLVLVVLGSALGLIAVGSSADNVERYTMFYLVAEPGNPDPYPRKAVVGQEVPVTLAVENREGVTIEYWVDLVVNGQGVDRIGPLTVGDGERVERQVSLVLNEVGDKQKVEFLLLKGDENSQPYRYTVMWIDVNSP